MSATSKAESQKHTTRRPVILTVALILTLSTLACTCGLSDLNNLPGISVTTKSSDTPTDQMLQELASMADVFTFDVDAVTRADDGTGKMSYRISSETLPGQDVTMERWVTVEPGKKSISGNLELVFENVGSETTDVVFVEEIPKSVLPTISVAAIQGVPADAITIIDEDPRFEIRLVEFAAGMRQTITVQIDPLAISAGIRMLMTPEGAPPDPEVVEYAAVRGIEIANAAIAMTARDYDFLRRSRICAAIPEENRDSRAGCLVGLVSIFPDKFTAGNCDEIQAIAPEMYMVAPMCKAFAENSVDRCNSLVDSGREQCILLVRITDLKRCFAFPANSQEQINCAAAADQRLAESCATLTDPDIRESCCNALSQRGLACEETGGGESAEEPDNGETPEQTGGGDTSPDATPGGSTGAGGSGTSFVDDGTVYPIATWASDDTLESTCRAIGRITAAEMELEMEWSNFNDAYSQDVVGIGVECLYRNPDVREHNVQYIFYCGQTDADIYDLWYRDHTGDTNDGYWVRYCSGGLPVGRADDVVAHCFDTEIFLDAGLTGMEQLHAVEYIRRMGNCSLYLRSSDPLPYADGGVETQHAATLRAIGDTVADYVAGLRGQ